MIQLGITEFNIVSIIFLLANIIVYICIAFLVYKHIQRKKAKKH